MVIETRKSLIHTMLKIHTEKLSMMLQIMETFRGNNTQIFNQMNKHNLIDRELTVKYASLTNLLKNNNISNSDKWKELLNHESFISILINKKIFKITQIAKCLSDFNLYNTLDEEEILLKQSLITVNDINEALENIEKQIL